MADLPELDQQSRPSTTIVSTAFVINWFQRCLDTMHQEFPWAGTVSSATGTVSTLKTANLAPTDFILDMRNGFWLKIGGTTRQLVRRNLADILMYQARNDLAGNPMKSQPARYSFSGRDLNLDITPDASYSYVLNYYAMPAVVTGAVVPNFPSDHVLVDYVYLRALVWARRLPQGSAMKYLREVEIPALREAGLSQEPESDHIPLDPIQFRGARRRPWDWMGVVRPNF